MHTRLTLALAVALVAAAPAQETHRFPPEGPQDMRTEPFDVGVVGPADSEQTAREYVQADDWQTLPPINYVTPPYAAQALEGIRICLDPGHGGDASQEGYKRGETGFRESVMNLTVGQYLRGFLEDAGAQVVLTREDDTNPEDGSLEYRARMADRENCDLFISLHHNATSRGDANYLSVWYHARPDNPLANVDLCRYIAMSLSDAMRHDEPQHMGLYSDWLMYPPDPEEGHPDAIRMDTAETIPSGFGVLRHARVPACLIEGSFYTNRPEELRLMDREYLRREAWGIFIGIVDYLWAGIPKITLHPEQDATVEGPRPTIRLALDDGMHEGWARNAPPRIQRHTLMLYIDGERCEIRFIPSRAELQVTPRSDLAPGEHGVRLRVLNAWGNWSWPREVRFTVE